MNERIRELAEQAENYATTRHAVSNIALSVNNEKFVKKFAELVARECAKFCDEVIKEVEIAMEQCEMVKTSDRLMMLHDGTRNGAQMSKIRIKKHFGVEE